jgi:cephalosporin hydroxylase
MQTLNIITPLSRLVNLPELSEQVDALKSSAIRIKWWVIMDNALEKHHKEIANILHLQPTTFCWLSPHTNAIAGHAHRNFALDKLMAMANVCRGHDEWVMFLDDDNYPDDSVTNFLESKEELLKDYDAILVDQYVFDKTMQLQLRLKADPNNVKVCHVDTAQIVFRLRALGDLRFIEDDYCADGHFIEALYNKNPSKFYFPGEGVCCYYNYIDCVNKAFEGEPSVVESSIPDRRLAQISECPVPLLQHEFEISQLVKHYRELNPKNIIEIGSFYGGTLWLWIQNAKLEKIVSIDWPSPSSDERYKEMVQSRSQWSSWISDDTMFFDIQGDSTAANTVKRANVCYPNKDCDFLFIDGGHDYKTVRSDFENYSPLVRQGGMIVFHDVVGIHDVKTYWNEIKLKHKYIEICGDPTWGWGIGIIFK